MLQKNIDKENRKGRSQWNGYYERITPSRKGKERKNEKKYKKDLTND